MKSLPFMTAARVATFTHPL